MPSASGPQADSSLSILDEAGTVDLCKSLADYGEAGSLSRDLMLRVGNYATSAYPSKLDVLLAVARMYRMGGELERAKTTLVGAGRLAPNEARTLGLLADVLAEMGIEGDPATILRGLLAEPTDASPARRDPVKAPARALEAASARAPREVSLSAIPADDLRRAVATTTSPPQAQNEPGTQKAGPTAITQPTLRALKERERAATPSSRGEPSPSTPRSARSSQGPDTPRARVNRIRLLPPDDPQRYLDPYELIAEIASGGMATVYLGRRAGPSGFQRLFAIKRLHPHLAREEQFVEMFLDEARLAAGIHHPHVVPILDVGESDHGYYLVMEFVEGETLSGLTSRAHGRGVMLPRLVAIRIVLDTLAGLHAAHQLKDSEGHLVGLVHRDCTPQNVLVGVDGSSRITDFGIARAAARLAVTRPLTVKGKVAYLSPEQATAGELDRRSDIFTMGIVLWEVLAGRPLFGGDSDAAIVSRLLTAPIPSLRNFAKDISPEIDEVCARALQRTPSRRYPTAAAMAEALERAALGTLGNVGSHTDVGRCVEMLMGPDMIAQRDELKTWMAQNDNPPPSRRRSLTEQAPPAPGATPEAGATSTTPAPANGVDPKKNSVESPSMLSLPPRDPAAPSPSKPPVTASQRPPALSAPALEPSAPAAPSWWTKKRLALIALGLFVLFVAGTAPIWFPRANRLRHRLMGHPVPTGTARPRPRPQGSARPRSSAPAATTTATAAPTAPEPAVPEPTAPEPAAPE